MDAICVLVEISGPTPLLPPSQDSTYWRIRDSPVSNEPEQPAKTDVERGIDHGAAGAAEPDEDAGPSGQITLPDSYYVGQDIDWDAPWITVELFVELPFWLMVDNTKVAVALHGHSFDVAIHDNYFELYARLVDDSRNSVVYIGPFKPLDNFGPDMQEFREKCPDQPLVWRKCKTVLRIRTRCNEHVLNRGGIGRPGSISMYLAELCRAHIPVINRLTQAYRLATYDYFPFEVSPWDVPRWWVSREGNSIPVDLLGYKTWDIKPPIIHAVGQDPVPYQLIDSVDLAAKLDEQPTPGELELLDALNLMERGDYSGAVRRVATAIEVVVEAVVGDVVESAEGTAAAKKFIRDTRTNFPRRITRYEKASGRKMPDAHRRQLDRTRKLRHRIVHGGYRIESGDRGEAQQSVDTGRWIFNWFENDAARRDVREKRIAFRGLGRDLTQGIFPSEITAEGIVISPQPRWTP